MNTLRVARAALRARPSAALRVSAPLQRRTYADAAPDKVCVPPSVVPPVCDLFCDLFLRFTLRPGDDCIGSSLKVSKQDLQANCLLPLDQAELVSSSPGTLLAIESDCFVRSIAIAIATAFRLKFARLTTPRFRALL